MHFGHMICLPWCNVSLHGSLHVNQHTDCALTIPRTGRWRFRICTKIIRSAYVHMSKLERGQPRTLRKHTYLGSVDQIKG